MKTTPYKNYLKAMELLDQAITYIDAISGGDSETLDYLMAEYEKLERTTK